MRMCDIFHVFLVAVMRLTVFFSLLVGGFGLAFSGGRPASALESVPNMRVVLAGFSLPKLLTPQRDGLYDQLMDHVQSKTVTDIDWISGDIVTMRRKFLQFHVACLFPVDVSVIQGYHLDPEQVIYTVPFNYSRIHVFSRVDKPVFSTLAQMKDKYIVFRRGYDLPEEIEENGYLITRVQTLAHGTNMLQTGRIDGLMAYVPDFFLVTEEKGQTNWHYDPTLRFVDAGERVLCHRSAQTVAFVKEFNASISRMTKTGELGAVLGPAQVLP